MLQQPDGRIVFVIPYERDFSLIGTTETLIDAPGDARATDAEVDYLLAAANRYMSHELTRDDVVHRFAGIRPLVLEEGKSARETTRDWKLIQHKGAAATTVVGGKITTYRLLAESVLRKIAPKTRRWTAREPLPGSDFERPAGLTGQQALARWLDALKARHPHYDPALVHRLARLYGTRADAMLDGGLGENLGGIFTAELDYLARCEWAETAEDVLWRRTKLGLHVGEAVKSAVAAWMAGRFTKN
jgi:glycerol-3-phosphate dehydrogenase